VERFERNAVIEPGFRSRNLAQPRGARSWSREDTQACSDTVFSPVGQSVATVAGMVRKTPMIASRSEAAKHCLQDGRIAPRGGLLRIPGNVKAHAPAVTARFRTLGLVKFIENFSDRCAWHAEAGVGNDKFKPRSRQAER
jgi:hypothetical protein